MHPQIAEATLTKAEAARVLGVSERTVYTWMDHGYLVTHETPGGRRPTVASVEQRLTQRSAAA